MKTTISLIGAAMILGGVGCSEDRGLKDPRHPTGSQTLAVSLDREALYVASEAEGRVSRVDLDRQTATELALDGQPTRIVRAGDHLLVSLRGERKIAVLQDIDGRLEQRTSIDIGAEPFGLVVDEDHQYAYAAAALSGRVYEIDVNTFDITRSWAVRGEPRWLALHPTGTLYAASAWQGILNTINLENDRVEQFSLPPMKSFQFETREEFNLSNRITGDLAVTPDGNNLLIPALYLDNTNPIFDPEDDGSDGPGFGGGGYSPDRFNPVVVVVTAKNGRPDMDNAQIVLTRGRDRVAGYPATVSVTLDSAYALVAIEGASGLVAFRIPNPLEEQDRNLVDNVLHGIQGPATGFVDIGGPSNGLLGMDSLRFVDTVSINTRVGPRAIVMLDERTAYVHAFLDRVVQRLNLGPILDRLAPTEDDPFIREPIGSVFSAQESTSVTEVTLPDEVETGRRLFYSTADSRMTSPGSGVSCATCHFDGRTDGITWTFTRGLRQTPSLAGQVSLTAPVRWEGDRVSVEEDALFTSQGLMGGSSIQDADLNAIGAFVDFTPDVDAPLKNSDNAAIARGKTLFESAAVGCATCHLGPRYTDNQSYSMFGMREVQTRSLTGVAGSPPYLHDGSAPTLRALLERVRDGSMGNTSSLSDTEMDDLEAYLQSL